MIPPRSGAFWHLRVFFPKWIRSCFIVKIAFEFAEPIGRFLFVILNCESRLCGNNHLAAPLRPGGFERDGFERGLGPIAVIVALVILTFARGPIDVNGRKAIPTAECLIA